MRRDPRVALLDMIQAAERATAFVREHRRETFLGDERTCYAVWAQIVILGEAVRRLPEEWQAQHDSVPWSSIAGMRHRLVHGYDIVDREIVWTVATRELPELLPELRRLLGD